MCFINRRDKYVLTSDSVINYPWLWLERCAPITEYLKGLQHFKAAVGDIKRMYCGHLFDPLPETLVDDLINAAEEILAGDPQIDPPKSVHPYEPPSQGRCISTVTL
jgi:hypothetical protein